MSSSTADAVAQGLPENAEWSPILIGDGWRPARAIEAFSATNPKTRDVLSDQYPVSTWRDLDDALTVAASAAAALRAMPDAPERIAVFLENYAARIETTADTIVAAASAETGLPVTPRLAVVELPRTVDQLRQAAAAARSEAWRRPTIDTKAGLRSCLVPVGPVFVIGPNNFPLAFNAISGGDFAAAIAAGNPVIAKAHPLHPTTSRRLAEAAHFAATAAGLPPGMIQMIYHAAPSDGLRLVGDARLAAVAFTGSRAVGLTLKAAADAAGKPFFGEMSSVNPVVLLPGALEENLQGIIDQFAASMLMGTGQFCTKPGLVLLQAGSSAEAFVTGVAAKLRTTPVGVLFSSGGQSSLVSSIHALVDAGADIVVGGCPMEDGGIGVQNTLLRATAKQFLGNSRVFQSELFGNAALVIVAEDRDQQLSIIRLLEGNLTGTIYSAQSGSDDEAYDAVMTELRPKVGRLINDKMPTGVAVSPAQQHGGPFPSSSQSHFTAVGLPGSILRFTQLEAYDNVRDDRLPSFLKDKNPTGFLWRQINGEWSQSDV